MQVILSTLSIVLNTYVHICTINHSRFGFVQRNHDSIFLATLLMTTTKLVEDWAVRYSAYVICWVELFVSS